MSGKFIPAAQADREKLDWGTLAWLSRPTTTEAEQLVVIEVNLSPGHGHNFHKHPEQEEVIYVIEGSIEQWLRQEKRMLNPGDSVFIPADTVHASFNVSSRPAKLLAILGPCVGPEGYQLVDVSGDAPWNALR
jgi:quercetin dioxygenase-like cupin family protein